MNTTLHPPRAIAVSVSDTPDIDGLGVSTDHVWDTFVELVIELLASGVDLAYGGDLRARGFTEVLFELAGRYRRPDQTLIRVTNYFAWPVHIRMSMSDLDEVAANVDHVAHLAFVGLDGTRLSADERRTLSSREPDEEDWRSGLTSMRAVMRSETSGRIAIGGQVENYKGRMPGIAEEALMSLKARQPLFLVGGFGGCTRDIAETLGLVDPWSDPRDWPERQLFEGYTAKDLRNGLTDEENRTLARTPFIGQARQLVMQGLYRLFHKDSRNPSHEDGRR